jgi:hypothetical protein
VHFNRLMRHENFRRVWAGVCVVGVALVCLSPIRGSGYFADDIPNSQWPVNLRAQGWSIFRAMGWAIDTWRTSEGRFYPVAAFEGVLIFATFTDRAAFKTMTWIATALCLVGLFALVGYIARSIAIGVLASGWALGAMQFRNWFDPYLSFGALLQSVALKLLLGTLALVWGIRCLALKKTATGVIGITFGSLLCCVAMLQYEIAILLVIPVALVMLLEPSPRLRIRSLCALPVLLFAGTLMIYLSALRSGVVNSAAYSINLATDRSIPAFAYQVFGAFPLSATLMRANGAPGLRDAIGNVSVVGWFGAIVIALGIAWLVITFPIPSRRARVQLLVFGLGLVLLSAVPIAVSNLRQTQLSWGNSYLPVFIEVLGVGILATVVVIECKRALVVFCNGNPFAPQHPRLLNVARWSGGLAIGFVLSLLIVVSYVNNDWASSTTKSWRVEKIAIDQAKENGFFDKFSNAEVVTGIDASGFGWMNGTYLNDGSELNLTTSGDVPPGSIPCSAGLCNAIGKPLYFGDVMISPLSTLVAVWRVSGLDPSGAPILSGSDANFFVRGDLPSMCRDDSSSIVQSHEWRYITCDVPTGVIGVVRNVLGVSP